ncbi:hypothetical protein LB505_001347 [Fusarium chuoi]|nr:hypothetical protein LB505_001347 [Fusarium chuoi]
MHRHSGPLLPGYQGKSPQWKSQGVTDFGSQCLKSKPKWWKLRSSSQNLPATPRVASNVSLCCQISWRAQNHSLIGAGHLGSSNSHGVIGQTVRQ